MPFKSEAQRRWMHVNYPEVAARWDAETPKHKKLPEKVTPKKQKKHSGFSYGKNTRRR